MTLQISTEATEELITDFANEFYDAYELCEIKLVELENNPSNQELINLIFLAMMTDLENTVKILQYVKDHNYQLECVIFLKIAIPRLKHSGNLILLVKILLQFK